MPPRRRTSNIIRKPRVAGLAPTAARSGGSSGAEATDQAGDTSSAEYREPGETTAGGRQSSTLGSASSTAGPPAPAKTQPSGSAGEEAGDSSPAAPPPAERPSGDALFGDTPDQTTDAGSADDASATRQLAQVAVLSREQSTSPVGGWRARVGAVRARPMPALVGALATFVVLGGGFAVADYLVRHTPAASNTALADVGTTADVANQLGAALETVYSYDFTQLDANERSARNVITPEFAAKFDQLFGQVRQLAPQQQAVVSAVVTSAAVQSIQGDRAVLVVFLDQQATRAAAGAEPQQVSAAGRLTVTGQLVDGTWKIAEVVNR